MSEAFTASWYYFLIGFILLFAGSVVLMRVKEKLPKYLVSVTLLVLAFGMLVWAFFVYHLADWGGA